MTSFAPHEMLLFEDARTAWGDLSPELLRGRSVLLTGASGLLGSHFLSALLQLRDRLEGELTIHAIARGELPPWFAGNAWRGGVRWLCGDLAQPAFVESLPAADIVIHAATYSQPALFTRDAIATLRLNTAVTLTLLDKVLPRGRFLFLSSSEVYSGLENPPYSEEQIGRTITTHPRACYIEGKRSGEAACVNYRRADVQARAARLCLAYGPGTRPGDTRVLNAFIERGLREGRIRLMDDGSARRAYCYISDAMHMLWRILLCGDAPIYNVGGVWRTSILELAERIGRELNVPVEVPAGASGGLAGAPSEVSLDCSRFQREFGAMRFVSPDEGIARCVAWHKALQTAQV